MHKKQLLKIMNKIFKYCQKHNYWNLIQQKEQPISLIQFSDTSLKFEPNITTCINRSDDPVQLCNLFPGKQVLCGALGSWASICESRDKNFSLNTIPDRK